MPSLFIVLVVSSMLATGQVTAIEKDKPLSYSGFQVWSFIIRSSEERALLNKLRHEYGLEVWNKESQTDEAEETTDFLSPPKVVEEIVVFPDLNPEPKVKLAYPKSKLNNPNGNGIKTSYTQAFSDNGNARNNIKSLNAKAELKAEKEPKTDEADETTDLPSPPKVVEEIVVSPDLKPEPKAKWAYPKSKLNNPNSNGIKTSYTQAVSNNGNARNDINSPNAKAEFKAGNEPKTDEAEETTDLPSPPKVVEEIELFHDLNPEPKVKLAYPKSKLNNPNGNGIKTSYTQAVSDNGNARNNIKSLNAKAGKEPKTYEADETTDLSSRTKVVEEVGVNPHPKLYPGPKMNGAETKPKLNVPYGEAHFGYQLKFSDVQTITDNGNAKKNTKSLNGKAELERWNEPKAEETETIDLLLPPQVVEELVVGPTEPEPQMKLGDSHVSYQIKISNLQAVIDMGNAKNNISSLNTKVGHSMDWTSYHRLDDIYGYLYYLVNKYPSRVELIKIGTSYEKRPLLVVRIFNCSSSVVKPAIWIDGGIHAREWLSPAVATYIIRQLVEVPANAALLSNVDWYIMPIMNPDGYEYTHVYDRLWRKTRSLTRFAGCRGVDPNRNFGYKWGGLGTSTNPCSDVYKGTSAFSEPETLATSNFIKSKVKSIKLYLTLHSFGQAALIPWGYEVAYPTDYADMLALVKSAVSKFTKYRYWVGNSAVLFYPAAGASDDWAKSIGIKYSYTFELPDIGAYGFLLPPSNILPVCQDFFPALDVFAAKVATLKV